MQKLLVATTNPGKVKELSQFLSDLPVKIISLKDLGITQAVKEDGKTYEENSRKKALFYSNLSGFPAVADDGGLEIHAFNNEPGLRSRRWLGYEATDEELIKHLQKVANSLPDDNRHARFVTVVTFALPTGEWWAERGEVKGIIAKNPHRKFLHGYPYRSFFFLPEIGKFYHENDLSKEEEKKYNHKRKAVEKLKKFIKKELHV